MPTTKGTFIRRTEKLQDRIGSGRIQASVKIDQIYAQYQHQRVDLNHMGVGQAMFLSTALTANYARWYDQLARHLYSPLGVEHWMIRISKNFANRSKELTPLFLSDLRRSTQPRVKVGGAFIYQGEARPRLNKAQLRAKARLYSQINRGGRR